MRYGRMRKQKGKKGGENIGKWRWCSWYHTRNKPRRRRRLWLRSSSHARRRRKRKKQKQFNLYLVGEVQIYTARGGKEKRAVIAHRRRETDRYSRFQFTFFPACKQSCGKKAVLLCCNFSAEKCGKGCGVATQFGAQRGEFFEGERERKTGARVRTPGKAREKKGVSERCRKLLKLIRLKRGEGRQKSEARRHFQTRPPISRRVSFGA